jgi:hypothetical protein
MHISKDVYMITYALVNVSLNLGGEKQVLAPAAQNHLVESGFVDGKVVGVPGVDEGLAEVGRGKAT